VGGRFRTSLKSEYWVLTILLILFSSSNAWADMLDIPVPITAIQPGERIELNNLRTKHFYVSESAAKLFATRETEVEGKIAKRVLLAAKPIALLYLRPAGTVLQGNPTKVILHMQGLVITSVLIPQQSGVAGQVVEALNPESGKIVKALVGADGSLQIGAQ
jgi:flagellar basal body P-ring formation protein FlgA